MKCPNDNTEMHQVKITSHYGEPILLEQCKKCGGIWFDESELFRAKQGEAEKIELLDTELLRDPTAIGNSKLTCSKHNAALLRFTDKYFPKDIIFERCPSCNGIWLNRGQFSKYQGYRQELKSAKETSTEDKKLDESISQLLAAHQSGNTSDTLERFGKFLSTPLGEYPLLPPDSSQRTPLAENTVNMILSILITILRTFIIKC